MDRDLIALLPALAGAAPALLLAAALLAASLPAAGALLAGAGLFALAAPAAWDVLAAVPALGGLALLARRAGIGRRSLAPAAVLLVLAPLWHAVAPPLATLLFVLGCAAAVLLARDAAYLAGLRALMDASADAVLLLDAHQRVLCANAPARRVFGAALAGLPWSRLLGAPGAPAGQRCVRLDGSSFPAEVRLASTGPHWTAAVVRDASERTEFEHILLEHVSHDPLTGLPNRALLLRQLDAGDAASAMLALLMLDLDQFKRINDTFGSAGGDRVLQQAAHRLGERLPAGALLARHEGDQFVVAVPGVPHLSQVADLAEDLLRCMRAPFDLDGHELFLTMSVGISVRPLHRQDGAELLHASGIALARAKADGDSYAFFTHGMGQSLAEQIDLEAALRHALPNGEFTVHYQPRYTIDGGALVGMEALLRWRHPRFGMVEPSRFIPLAERNGLIAEIGMWVLDCACAQMLAWRRAGLALVPVAVNLSARQFRQEGLDELIGQALVRSSLPASLLELEITESTLMHDTAAATQTLRALKRLGVSLSVDDFGTGYSCLSYLKLFPLDVLKIDRSFVLDVTHSVNDAAIVRAIVGLAHSLDLRAVAEGVENAEQQAFLRECGCDEVQGYHFGRPAPPEDIALLLARAQPVAEGDPA